MFHSYSLSVFLVFSYEYDKRSTYCKKQFCVCIQLTIWWTIENESKALIITQNITMLKVFMIPWRTKTREVYATMLIEEYCIVSGLHHNTVTVI